ncbi:MAG: hypothetical protein QW156_03805 [Candidatus Aenigmatarchaeota archaeon]
MKAINLSDIDKEVHLGALLHSLKDFYDYFTSNNLLHRYCNLIWGLYNEFIITYYLDGNFVDKLGWGDFEKNGYYYDIKITNKDIVYLPCHRVLWGKYDYILFSKVVNNEIILLGTLPRITLSKFPKWVRINGRYIRANQNERDDKCVYILFLNRLHYGSIP